MPAFTGSASTPNRDQLALRARGIIAETDQMGNLAASSVTISSGRVVYGLVGLRAGDSITKIGTIVSTSAVGSSSLYVGVYDANLARVAVSTNLTTGLEVAVPARVELAVTYVATADGGYYLALFWAGVTTAPTIRRGAISDVSVNESWNSGKVSSGVQDGQTGLPTTAVISTLSGAGVPYLVALGTPAV